MKFSAYKTIVLTIAAIILLPIAALADAAPDYASATVSSDIGPVKENAISMDHERVIFDIPDTNSYSTFHVGNAHATFWMLNPSDQDIRTTSTFPFSYIIDNGPEKKYVATSTISVTVDDRPVSGSIQTSSFPVGEPGHLKLTTSTGYVFPLAISAHKTAKVDIDFEYPYTYDAYSRNITFQYVLATGAGWSGPIKSAVFTVNYPQYDASASLQDDWIRLTQGDDWTRPKQDGEEHGNYVTGKISGLSATFVLQNFEPSPKSDLTFTAINTGILQQIIQANNNVKTHPTDPAAYENLANVYYEAGDSSSNYWNNAIHALELRYGSTTAPTTGEAALAVEQLYSGDDWFGCEAGCDGSFFDEKKFLEMLNYVKAHHWTDSDMPALAELRAGIESNENSPIKLKDYAFLPRLATSTQDASKITSSTKDQESATEQNVTDTKKGDVNTAIPSGSEIYSKLIIALTVFFVLIVSFIVFHSIQKRKK